MGSAWLVDWLVNTGWQRLAMYLHMFTKDFWNGILFCIRIRSEALGRIIVESLFPRESRRDKYRQLLI